MKLKSTLPQFHQDYFILKSYIHPYENRGASGIHIIQARTNYRVPHLWNSLPLYLTITKSIFQFKAKFQHYLINTKFITED